MLLRIRSEALTLFQKSIQDAIPEEDTGTVVVVETDKIRNALRDAIRDMSDETIQEFCDFIVSVTHGVETEPQPRRQPTQERKAPLAGARSLLGSRQQAPSQAETSGA